MKSCEVCDMPTGGGSRFAQQIGCKCWSFGANVQKVRNLCRGPDCSYLVRWHIDLMAWLPISKRFRAMKN